MALLEVNDLHTSFFTDAGEVKAVDGVSFRLDHGKVLGIVGESGSGKSVTAYSVMQILAPTGKIVSGSVKFDGQELVGADEKLLRTVRGNRISIIFQDPMTSLNPTYTIGRQLMEAILLHTNRNRHQARERAVEMLKLVNVNEPEKRMKQYPFELSGGMRQRVMIAMALACEPDILIADEPTTALDVTIQAQILDLMRDLQKKMGMAIIMITHDLGVVAQMCDEVIVMYAGSICEQGTADEIFYNPRHEYTKGLMRSIPTAENNGQRLEPITGTPIDLLNMPKGCPFAPRCEAAMKICLKEKPVRMLINDDHMATCWMNVKKGVEDGSITVEVKGLKEYFDINMGFFRTKPLKAVDDVSFTINKGETLGLVGESGCGKTTVGRTILQLYKPTAGEIIYDGKPVKTKADLQKFRTKATMVFQDPYSSLNPRMTVSDIVGEPLDVHHLYSSKKEREERILQLLGYVGLNSEHASRYAHEFSGGQRQRIGIARALAVNPEFIVCDEPVSALDVSIQAQVINMFDDLQDRLGLTYLFIAHDLLVVRHISDRIAVMYLGKMVELASAEEIYNHPLHPYSKSLLSAVPLPDPKAARANKRIVLSGDIPSPLNAPSGCPFRTRCPYATEACAQSMPPFNEVEKGHFVACHRVKELG